MRVTSKFQISSTKFQISSKFQFQNCQDDSFSPLTLPLSPVGRGRGWGESQICLPRIYLGFDIWNLEFNLLFSLIRECFIDQHDGDILFDGIEQVAGLADQTVSIAIQENISLALRASQNFQEFFTDGHLHPPFLKFGWCDSWRRIHSTAAKRSSAT